MTGPRVVRPLGARSVAGVESTGGLSTEGRGTDLDRGSMPLPILPGCQPRRPAELPGEGALVEVAALLGDVSDGQRGRAKQSRGGVDPGLGQELPGGDSEKRLDPRVELVRGEPHSPSDGRHAGKVGGLRADQLDGPEELVGIGGRRAWALQV